MDNRMEQALEIIPYQVITGNYDVSFMLAGVKYIIPYQVITGNYDLWIVVVLGE